MAAWRTELHSTDPHCEKEYDPEDRYLDWVPKESILDVVRGKDGVEEIPWTSAQYAIMICNVGEDHWVTVRIRFLTMTVELYDSVLKQADTSSSRDAAQRRERQLLPLLRLLLPRIMYMAGYWS